MWAGRLEKKEGCFRALRAGEESMKKNAARWVVISMVHGEDRALEAEQMLTREGFMVRLHSVYGENETGEQLYEVMALSSEAKEARQMLLEKGY